MELGCVAAKKAMASVGRDVPIAPSNIHYSKKLKRRDGDIPPYPREVSRRPHCCSRSRCEVGFRYAITYRINRVAAAAPDNGAALAVHELVRWRFSVGVLAN